MKKEGNVLVPLTLLEKVELVIDKIDNQDIQTEHKAWLTQKEAEKYIGVCFNTMKKARDNGKLRSTRVGNRLKYKKEWLDEFVELKNNKTLA